MVISETLNLFSDLPAFPMSIGGPERKVLSVSQLTNRIKTCLETGIGYVWVTGEVSNLRQPTSGHLYFSLKDESSQIRCVLFAGSARGIKFKIEGGQELIIFGRVSLYARSGDYQIIVEKVEPKGVGALQLAFEQLKNKLAREGLFEPARKKPIPFLPQRIGLITSPTGAAIKDVLNIIDRRWAEVSILIYPVRVQGEGAAEEISAALKDFNTMPGIDVLILTRGGGSAEDLWAFNEEILARQIAASRIPVISAVGHEIDVTIADLVADKRALTPSEAGELVVPVKDEVEKTLKQSFLRLTALLQNQVQGAYHRLEVIRKSHTFRQPLDQIEEYYQQLDDLLMGLPQLVEKNIQECYRKLQMGAGRLESLSPLQVIKRGYTVTKRFDNNRLIKSVNDIKINDEVLTQVKDGKFIARVNKIFP